MDAEERRIREQIKQLPLKERFANFWHYYKNHILIIGFFAVIIGASVVQCCTRIKYDMSVSMYSAVYFSEEQTQVLVDLLKEPCEDIHNDGEVNVSVAVNIADIREGATDQMAQAVLMKLPSELVAKNAAGYIMDSAFRDFMVNTYEYPAENIIDITDVPGVSERLKLPQGEKLFWLSELGDKKSDKPNQFDNGRRVEQYLKDLIK